MENDFYFVVNIHTIQDNTTQNKSNTNKDVLTNFFLKMFDCVRLCTIGLFNWLVCTIVMA